MTHDIIDNRDQSLADAIRRILPGSQSVKFAVGYFFLSGMECVADSLKNVQEICLLIGNTTSRETIEQISEGYRRLEQAQEHSEAQTFARRADLHQRAINTGAHIADTIEAMDQNEENMQLLGLLVRLITENRLHVRVYTRGRLHSKAYIFDYAQVYDAAGNPIPRPEHGIAVVGSSNLTLSGLTHNSELNVVVHGNENHAALTLWFERLWEESEQFEAHLLQELQSSWALATVTPYEVYLKALYELVKDRLEESAVGEFLWQNEITTALTEFQRNAVRRAVQIIRRYGGAFISDVVGLGKSYTGAAIVKHFERHDHTRALILCPPSLIPMWEHYNEAYALNARVESIGMLRVNPNQPDYNYLLDNEIFKDRDFILIDESHNFRSPGTQRYHILQEYLQAGDRKCVFLTATPRDRDVWDIYHQLKLFHVGDRTQIPIDPPNLNTYFKAVVIGERSMASLLSNIMVRRTRMDVLRWYGFDAETHQRVNPFAFDSYRRGDRRAYVEVNGRPQFFPKRNLHTIEYNIEATYRGLYSRLLTWIGKTTSSEDNSEHLTYARYGLWHYVHPEKQEVAPYNELRRAGYNLRGLMRISLFKRFESSVAAFRTTIIHLLNSHRAFLRALNEGIVPAGEDAADLLNEADEMEETALFDALHAITGRYKLEDFDANRLQADVEHDVQILEDMLSAVEPITPAQDDKLQTLMHWLDHGETELGALRTGKCLIFTQYVDTARYLYENLNPQQRPEIESIYSQSKDKSLVAARFSPGSNPGYWVRGTGTEIQLLIATDVLSEGLNLQDCDRVINYDLHWNPMRLIQRFGRIDRIGTQHDQVYGFNFLPETEIERSLGLQVRLSRRIQEIHDTLGEDAAILDPSERLNQEAFMAIYQGNKLEQYESSDADDDLIDLTEAEEFIRQLRETEPELYKRIQGLRNGIRAAKQGEHQETIVLNRAGSFHQLSLINENGDVISQDIPIVLNRMRCTPATPGQPLAVNHNAQVMAIHRKFKDDMKAIRAEQRHTATLTRAQQYVLRELRRLYDVSSDEDFRAQVEVLDAAFRQPLTQAIRAEMNTIYRRNVSDLALFDVLNTIYIRHDLHERLARLQREQQQDDLELIICSMGLV